jgi:hypothetical protein
MITAVGPDRRRRKAAGRCGFRVVVSAAVVTLTGCAGEPEGWYLTCAGAPGSCWSQKADLGPTPGTAIGDWVVDERNRVRGPPPLMPGPIYEIGSVEMIDAFDVDMHR